VSERPVRKHINECVSTHEFLKRALMFHAEYRLSFLGDHFKRADTNCECEQGYSPKDATHKCLRSCVTSGSSILLPISLFASKIVFFGLEVKACFALSPTL